MLVAQEVEVGEVPLAVVLCYDRTTSLTQIHRTASFIFLLLSPHTVAHVRYDLMASLCTIQSDGLFRLVLYDINLGATHTTILSIRGVQIPIYLASSATDSF